LTEKSELKRVGAKPHKNSGRGMKKADGTLDNFIVDVKEYSKSFSVSQDVWAKIVTDTIRVDPNKSPVIMLVLGKTKKVRLAIIEWSEFEYLKEKAENNE
jgi:hypothetical protein